MQLPLGIVAGIGAIVAGGWMRRRAAVVRPTA
jgi:hypothetical protein